MQYAIQIVYNALSAFFNWFISLPVYSTDIMTVYLYQLIIVGAILLPFIFGLLTLHK